MKSATTPQETINSSAAAAVEHQTKITMLSMSSDEEEYSEIATPDLINYDEKKMVTDKYGSISLCKFFITLLFTYTLTLFQPYLILITTKKDNLIWKKQVG